MKFSLLKSKLKSSLIWDILISLIFVGAITVLSSCDFNYDDVQSNDECNYYGNNMCDDNKNSIFECNSGDETYFEIIDSSTGQWVRFTTYDEMSDYYCI